MWPMIEQWARDCTAALEAVLLDFRQPHFAQGLLLGVLFLSILFGQPARSRGSGAGRSARWEHCSGSFRGGQILGLHKDASSCDKCNRCLLHCQGGDDPIGGVPWRKSRVPDVHELRGRCPHDEPGISVLPQRGGSGNAGPWPPAQRRDGSGCRAAPYRSCAPIRVWARAAMSGCSGRRVRWMRPTFFPGAFAAASA